MILGLRSPFDHGHVPARVGCRLGNDLKEQRLGDVVGAGARD
jgi:hypothetical protein